MTVILDSKPGRPSTWFYITAGDEREAGDHHGLYLDTHVGQLDTVGLTVKGERQLDWTEALQILDHYEISDVETVADETFAIAAAITAQRNRTATERPAA